MPVEHPAVETARNRDISSLMPITPAVKTSIRLFVVDSLRGIAIRMG